MKIATLLIFVLLASTGTLAGCSKPETESASNATWANQNPSRRVSDWREAKNLDPNTGEPRKQKEQNEKN